MESNEEKYHILANSTKAISWICDVSTWQFTFVGAYAETLLGYRIEEWYQENFWQNHIHPDDREHTINYCVTSTQRLEDHEFEYRMITSDGRIVWIYDIAKVIHSNAEPIQLHGFMIDITERKQMEEELRILNESLERHVAERTAELSTVNEKLLIEITERKKAEEQLHQINDQLQISIDNMPNAYILWDKDLRVVEWNKAAEKIFGYSKQEMLGKNPVNYIVPKPVSHHVEDILRKLKIGEVADYSEKDNNIRKDGKLISCQWFNTPLTVTDKKGDIFGFLTIAQDITERKKAEELLQKQKKDLEQKNIALSEILGQIEIEKKQIKENVIINAETLLLPIIQKLRLTGESRKYIQLLQKNLQELTSSFGTKLTEKRAKLTSREVEICNMIKNGLTSKEIASLLNISLRTAEKHRINIRNKLGIVNKNLNLTSFLQTF